MATGSDAYDALKRATAELPIGSEFEINFFDAIDLRKLTVDDLLGKHYCGKIAEEVCAALSDGDFEPFSKSLGLQLSVNMAAPRLQYSE